MNELKIYFKSKEFLISTLIIIGLTGINIYSYIKNTYIGDGDFIDGVNRFSFWNYVMHYNFGSLLMFLSPIIICILSLSMFYYKLSGSFFKDQLLRNNYNKIIRNEIFFSYFKAILPFLTVSFLVFLLGCLLFPAEITNTMYSDQLTLFNHKDIYNPYLFVAFSNLLLILYLIMVVNFGIIVLRITKKLNISLITTFIIINAVNFIVGNVAIFIGEALANQDILNYSYNINIYEGYFVQSTIFRGFLHTTIYIVITLILIYIKYRNKELLVNEFD